MTTNPQYYKLGEAAVKTGLHRNTIYKYATDGKIRYIKTPGGQKMYDISTITSTNTIDTSKDIIERNICYCRVSTYGQKSDLKRQIKYMETKYPEYEIISDIGSGINFKRRGLQKIIEYAIQGSLKKLVVAYKDRLCRIGYELIEHILLKYSSTEIIVDNDKTESINEEIANDILQIITVYSAKINGMRQYIPSIGADEEPEENLTETEILMPDLEF